MLTESSAKTSWAGATRMALEADAQEIDNADEEMIDKEGTVF